METRNAAARERARQGGSCNRFPEVNTERSAIHPAYHAEIRSADSVLRFRCNSPPMVRWKLEMRKWKPQTPEARRFPFLIDLVVCARKTTAKYVCVSLSVSLFRQFGPFSTPDNFVYVAQRGNF